MPRLLASVVALLAIGAMAGTAIATTASTPPTPVGSTESDQPSEPVPGVDKNKSLSEQLDEDKGVIKPPPTGDSEIHTTAPNPNPGTMPVIPPPGTPGGDESVQPK
jgi:hypothetical protein